MPPINALALRPLVVAGLYLAIWLLGARLPRIAQRRLQSPGWQRIQASLAWRSLGRTLGLGYTVGACYLALYLGWLAPLDMGFKPWEWPTLASWLPIVTGVMCGWAVFLWGSHWLAITPPRGIGPIAAYGTPFGLLAHVVAEEAQASILRGALVPVVGLYWGAWAVLPVKIFLAWGTLKTEPEERAFRYLDWGMEAAAAGCFATSGSLWASLFIRAIGHGVVNVLHRILANALPKEP